MKLKNILKLAMIPILAGSLNGCVNEKQLSPLEKHNLENAKVHEDFFNFYQNYADKFKIGEAGIVLAGGLNNLYGQDTILRDSSNRVYSENLCINLNDKIQHITKKNEEQGINDIRKIINASDYEEKWLYLPEKQKWYEIGFNSCIIPGEEASVSHSIKDIKRILEKNKDVKELIFYHNHPRFPKDSLIENSPSLDDFKATMENQRNFPNYKIKEKICSKEGIIEYSLTEKAIKEFSSRNAIKLEDYYSYMKDNSITFNPEYFTLTFKPHENKKNDLLK